MTIKKVFRLCIVFLYFVSLVNLQASPPVYEVETEIILPNSGGHVLIPVPNDVGEGIRKLEPGDEFIIRDESARDHHFERGDDNESGYPDSRYLGSEDSDKENSPNDDGSSSREDKNSPEDGVGFGTMPIGIGPDLEGMNHLESRKQSEQAEERFKKTLENQFKNQFLPKMAALESSKMGSSIDGGQGKNLSDYCTNQNDMGSTRMDQVLLCFNLASYVPKFTEDDDFLKLYFAMSKRAPDDFKDKELKREFEKFAWGLFKRVEEPYYNNLVKNAIQDTEAYLQLELDRTQKQGSGFEENESFDKQVLSAQQSQVKSEEEDKENDLCELELNPFECLEKSESDIDKIEDKEFATDLERTETKLINAGPQTSVYRESVRQTTLEQVQALEKVVIKDGVSEESKDYFYKVLTPMAEVALGLSPLSIAVDSYEALTGKNLITGEPLDSFERSMAILGLATLGFSSKLTKGIKWLSKIIAPTKMGTKALGMAERVLDTAQRIVGNDKGKVATFLRNVKDGNWSKVFEATPPSKILDAPHVQKKFRSDLGVPNTWVSKKAKKGDGLIFHESNNIHTDIRVMPGKKDSPFPNSQKPYIEFKKNGIYLDKFGNQLPNNRNEAAHIPLGEFKFNR